MTTLGTACVPHLCLFAHDRTGKDVKWEAKTLKERSWARNLMSRCFIGKHPSWTEIYSSALPPKDVVLSLLWNSWQAAVAVHWVSTRIPTNTWEFSPFACLLLQICLHLPEHRFTNFACANPHFLFGALAGNLEAFSEDIRSLLVQGCLNCANPFFALKLSSMKFTSY